MKSVLELDRKVGMWVTKIESDLILDMGMDCKKWGTVCTIMMSFDLGL